jgi:hypothetical protein
MPIGQVRDLLYKLSTEDRLVLSNWIQDLHAVLKDININIYGPSILIIKGNNELKIRLIDFTTYEKYIINKQFQFKHKTHKKEQKRMRKFLVRYNKLDALKTMHDDILDSLISLCSVL